MRGPISDYNFAIRQFAVVSLQTRKAFRLIGPVNYLYQTSPWSARSQGWFEIDPVGANDTDELFLGYVSCNWIWPSAWVAATSYSSPPIVRAGDGYVYVNTTGGLSGSTRPYWATGTNSDGGINWTVYTEPYGISSDNTNLQDTDQVLFDDDLMIEGMRWAYYRAKGQSYEQERQDWEDMVKGAISRFDGPVRISMAETIDGDCYDWPLTPEGSWDVS